MELLPQFLEIESGSLFVLHVRSGSRPRLRVLVLPPFAEELNKCRRLIALTARRLAADGCDVLVPDLFGTGDSDGDFGEATWERWVRDLIEADVWFSRNSNAGRAGCLAIRSGFLLANDTFADGVGLGSDGIVAWQPVFNGGLYLQQFLRLRIMAARLAGIEDSQGRLEQQLGSGESVEVAGYELSSELAKGLRGAIAAPANFARAKQVALLEFKSGESASLTAPTREFADAVANAGGMAQATVVNCEPFWTTQEIATPEAALDATVDAFRMIGAGT